MSKGGISGAGSCVTGNCDKAQAAQSCYLSRVSGIHFQMLERDERVMLKEYVEHGSEDIAIFQIMSALIF